MGRNLGPALRQELENLGKDTDSRLSAVKALKSYVKDLDSKTIPLFLAQVSETKETGSLSGEYTISLYEILARVHGPKIVPQIENIMSTIIKTLASSAGSLPLQRACSKVVPAVARYGIDPTTPEDKKRHIIHSLCKPLSDSLLGSHECLTSGAALCLKALVDSNNWRYASDDMVNKVCQNVAVALTEKSTQTKCLMGLVMGLAKHNALIVEAYARLLIQSGLQILNSGYVEENSQKRLLAIQMVNLLMKCLDPRSIYSELELVIEEMEKCQSDQMAYVRGAAFEALQTAKRIVSEKGLKFEAGSSTTNGFNVSKRDCGGRGIESSSIDRSPTSISPDSDNPDHLDEYDALVESPTSVVQPSHNAGHGGRILNRRKWRYGNGGVAVSHKDGLFSEVDRDSTCRGTYSERCDHCESSNEEYHTENFAGFLQSVHENGPSRSKTPSPQRPQSYINVDNISIYSTPRKLIHSLQNSNNVILDAPQNQTRRFRSSSSSIFQYRPWEYNQNGFSHDVNLENNESGDYSAGDEQMQGSSESVSSTDDIHPSADQQISDGAVNRSTTGYLKSTPQKFHKIFFSISLFGLCLLLVAAIWISSTDRQDGYYVVPT